MGKSELIMNGMYVHATLLPCIEKKKVKIIGPPHAKLKIVKDKAKKSLRNQLKKLQRRNQKLSNLGEKNEKLIELLKIMNQNQKRKVGEKNWRKSKSKRKKRRNKRKRMQKLPQLCPRQPKKELWLQQLMFHQLM